MNLFERTAKINGPAGVFAALAGTAALLQQGSGGGDPWLRVAVGREIWARGAPPSVDAFSFSFAGQPWHSPSWLFDLLAFGAFSLGPAPLAWLQYLVLLAALGLLLWISCRRGPSLLAAGAALWLGAACAGPFLAIDPASTSLLPLAVLLALRELPRGPWAWPLVLVVWANLDPSFAVGVIALLIDAGAEVAHESRQKRRPAASPRAWLGLAACAAALLLNPAGPGALADGLAALLPGGGFQHGEPWRAPGFSLDPADFAGRFAWLALAAAAGALLAIRSGVRDSLLALVLFALAARSRTLIPFFAIAAIPLAARAFDRGLREAPTRWPALAHPALPIAATVTALCAAGWLWSGVRVQPHLFERWTDAGTRPSAAVCFLGALDPGLRVLNRYPWGGYLIWRLPESRVFIDARGAALYDEDLLDEYAVLAEGHPGSRALLTRYQPEAALLAAGARPPQLRGGWQVLYQDSVAQVLVPGYATIDPAGAARARSACANEAQARVRAASEQRSVELADAALRQAPLLLSAYAARAQLAAEQRDADAIEATLEAGLRAYPRRSRALHEIAGRAYERAGYLPRALQAYRRALPAGPLESAASRRAHVQRLEARLRPPEQGGNDD